MSVLRRKRGGRRLKNSPLLALLTISETHHQLLRLLPLSAVQSQPGWQGWQTRPGSQQQRAIVLSSDPRAKPSRRRASVVSQFLKSLNLLVATVRLRSSERFVAHHVESQGTGVNEWPLFESGQHTMLAASFTRRWFVQEDADFFLSFLSPLSDHSHMLADSNCGAILPHLLYT